jgi:hypothetical protein
MRRGVASNLTTNRVETQRRRELTALFCPCPSFGCQREHDLGRRP